MSDKKLMIKASLFSAVCGILSIIILTSLFACVMLGTGIMPQYIVNYAAIGIVGITAMFSGFISSRITKSAGLITGLLTGAIIFFLITVFGLIKSSEPVSIHTLLKLTAAIAGGSIGGIIGVNKKEKIQIK